jgi:hypothetical protein
MTGCYLNSGRTRLLPLALISLSRKAITECGWSTTRVAGRRGSTAELGHFEVISPVPYGYMRVYGEDTTAIPGTRAGETVTFKVNGLTAHATGDVVWQDDKITRPVDLAAVSVAPEFWSYLPMILK